MMATETVKHPYILGMHNMLQVCNRGLVILASFVLQRYWSLPVQPMMPYGPAGQVRHSSTGGALWGTIEGVAHRSDPSYSALVLWSPACCLGWPHPVTK